MRITPLEIRKKTFEKQMRGYDKEEVNAFLLSLSHEWEKSLDQIKSLDSQLKKAESDVTKLREVEASLYKTLKTAEDTGANMINQAKKTADLHIQETQLNADGLLNESKSKARNIIDDAELTAKQILGGMDDELKELARVYNMLEDHRDEILNELTNLSTITLQRVQKVSDNLKHFDMEKRLNEIYEQSAEGQKQREQAKSKPVAAKPKPSPKPVIKPVEKVEEDDIIEESEMEDNTGNNSNNNSFFDELD